MPKHSPNKHQTSNESRFSEFLQRMVVSSADLNLWLTKCFPNNDFQIFNNDKSLELIRKLDEDNISKDWDNTNDKDIKNKWDIGWNEISSKFSKSRDLKDLTPQYVKSNILRICSHFVEFKSKNAEHIIAENLLEDIFDQYIINPSRIHEFGCGTGKNLLILDRLFSCPITGCDWVNNVNEIITILNNTSNNIISFNTFNMLEPDFEYKINKDDVVITVHSMEQLGTKFIDFFDFLKIKKPKLIINIEPEKCFYSNNMFDKTAKDYHIKRGYLDGFSDHLVSEQLLGNIEILNIRNFHFGSLRHEAYNLFIWRPI